MTISRAAELPSEHEELLLNIATDMEPEDGRLWIYGTDDRQTVASTPAGMKYLRELRAECKRKRSRKSWLFAGSDRGGERALR